MRFLRYALYALAFAVALFALKLAIAAFWSGPVVDMAL